MKAFIKNILILANIFSITACTAYFWNGHYSLQKTAEEIQKREEAFYAKETPEQQKLRKKNQIICENLARKKYPNETIWEGYNSFKRSDLYKECMKERGTPMP